MSDTNTRTAETAFGAIDYQTVTCASCETEIRKADAQRFVIGDLKRHRRRRNCQRYEFHSGTTATGWACEHCRTNGPIEFPARGKARVLAGIDPMNALLAVTLVLWAVVIVGSALGVI